MHRFGGKHVNGGLSFDFDSHGDSREFPHSANRSPRSCLPPKRRKHGTRNLPIFTLVNKAEALDVDDEELDQPPATR